MNTKEVFKVLMNHKNDIKRIKKFSDEPTKENYEKFKLEVATNAARQVIEKLWESENSIGYWPCWHECAGLELFRPILQEPHPNEALSIKEINFGG